MRTWISFLAIISHLSMIACGQSNSTTRPADPSNRTGSTENNAPIDSPLLRLVVEGAVLQTLQTRTYDPSYVNLSYPGGDPAPEKGVCADVIVRAFRKGGVDLQKEVHEDMKANFAVYPNKWGARRPDPNIDHRRVANLMTFFDRQAKSVPVTSLGSSYLPGDVVAWDLGGDLLHIGIVTNVFSDSKQTYKIVHNIGLGARLEDVLFSWKVIGHYRYF
jgi:uncharacterized protein YijF (DUF1287 family)